MVTVRYWKQDMGDSGEWADMRLSESAAEVLIRRNIYDKAYILEDDEKEGNQHLEDKSD